jgi:hypothetical protein
MQDLGTLVGHAVFQEQLTSQFSHFRRLIQHRSFRNTRAHSGLSSRPTTKQEGPERAVSCSYLCAIW